MSHPAPEQLNSDGKPLPVQHCHVCGYKFDAASESSGGSARPKAGDATLCLRCGEFYVFAADGTIHQPTLDEAMAINSDPDASRLLRRTQRLIRQKRPLSTK